MSTPLRALLVEDSEDDAELLVLQLRKTGYDLSFERVETREGLVDALDRGGWDILFADYTMPRFQGAEALDIVRERSPDLPVIFVSGTMGEDVAVEAMKAGADDYFVKGNLGRLPPALARTLRQAEARREQARIESQRRAAEEALAAAEERHRLLFEHIADAILVLDRQGMISLASASVREVMGYEPEDLVGRSCLDLVHAEDTSQARESLARATSHPDTLASVEVRMRCADGSWRSMDCVLRNLLHRSDVEGLVMTCRDVTERKRLETEFLQVQKLESVGRLAGGIAHDFNNLLTAVMAYADILLDDPDLGDRRSADVLEIRSAAERAATLTRQLLAFSRRQVLDMRPLDLNDIVEGMTQMLGRVLGEEIQVRCVLEPNLATVRADAGQVEQVLLNLAVNARDAMPTGGTLTIATTNVDIDEAYAEQHFSAEVGRYVLISVSDTGIGMDAATQARLFEPFFTTKDPGKGTGLGLATVYGIVDQSGGFIRAFSEEGAGTAFEIHLPSVAESAERPPPRMEAEPAPGGTETVLLVEDESAVRELAARILRSQGYTVLPAEDGEEARLLLADNIREIDLLLTDAVLPGEGGEEVADHAVAMRPGLPVLFMSGYATSHLAERGILKPGVRLLDKPFTAASLARKVRDALDESKAGSDPA